MAHLGLAASELDSNRVSITDYLNEEPSSSSATRNPHGNHRRLPIPPSAATSLPSSSQISKSAGPTSTEPIPRSLSNSTISKVTSDGTQTQIRRLPAIPRSLSFNNISQPSSSTSTSAFAVTATVAAGDPIGYTSTSPHDIKSSRLARPLPQLRSVLDHNNASLVASPTTFSPSNGIHPEPKSMSSSSTEKGIAALHSIPTSISGRYVLLRENSQPGPNDVITSLPMAELPSESSRHRTQTHVQPRNASAGSSILRLHEPHVPPEPFPFHRTSTELDTHPSIRHSIPYSTSASDIWESRHSRNHLDNEDHERDEDDDRPEATERDEREMDMGVEFDRMPALTPKQVKPSSWWRTFIPSTWSCRLFVLVILLEAILDITIEANILWRFHLEVRSDSSTDLILENRRRLPVYLIIFGLAHLWQIVLTFIAVRSKNTIQMMAVTFFNYAFLGYAVMMIHELRKILGDLSTSLQDDAAIPADPATGSTINKSITSEDLLTLPLNILTFTVIAILAVGCLSLTVLAWFMRKEFGWQRYRFLGADLQIRQLYQRFQIFECICYFTAFFCAGFGIQFIWLVLQPTDSEYVITWIMFPLLFLLLILGRFAAKYENKWMMYTFLLGILLGEAYFIFKLVRIWQSANTIYYNLTKSMTLFDSLSIVSLGACGVWGVWVGMSFERGLKGAVLSSPNTSFLSSYLQRRNRIRNRKHAPNTHPTSIRSGSSLEKGHEMQIQPASAPALSYGHGHNILDEEPRTRSSGNDQDYRSRLQFSRLPGLSYGVGGYGGGVAKGGHREEYKVQRRISID